MAAGRKEALEAYRRGALEEALAIQQPATAHKDASADDFLLLALLFHSSKRVAEAVSTLREGVRRNPGNADLHENLGVCLIAAEDLAGGAQSLERALALGSRSPNILDGLCRAYGRLGRQEESIAYGRKSLEAKDARFGAAAPLARVPEAPAPAFDPAKPHENVISYVLWGENPRYVAPLLENLRVRGHLFPAWTIRVYVDRSVTEATRRQLERGGAQLILKEQPAGELPARKLLWRFEVIAEPAVKRFLVRDADSLLSVKERVAVDDWLRSGKYFHVMRDYHSHTDLVLAGLWGGVAGVLPPLAALTKTFKPWRVENDHVDQDLLTVTAWPTIRQSCLMHDSVFTGCLGSVPFPPYGEMPRGHHVGQNAFIHFRQGS